MSVLGVLLAAGAGTRLGMPGGLMRAADGTPWVVTTVATLRAAGCGPIGVVVGAAAPDVVALLAGEDVTVVPSPDWSDGLSYSVKAAFAWAEQTDASSALFHMVDRPEVGPAVLERVVAASAPGPAALARAGFSGFAGYPVFIGRDHWAGAAAAATGDRSMGPYLKRVPCPLIPCDDLL
ncbi:nucleotidyltransferase family protein [Kribbella sp. DT2]|uniref:nucleotidyltransferase family protein n=1 Tax=Kribbella sp. DT2 TaxID=3393427 RepID=UPI003CEE8B4A